MKTIEWGFLIVSYLFLGGLSAGLFFVSAIGAVLHGRIGPAATRVARLGAWLAPWPVMLGCFLLIFDLGKWYRFYKLFIHIRWLSPMSAGSWLLSVFVLISLSYSFAWLDAGQRRWFFSRLPRWLQPLRALDRDLSSWRRTLALTGLPVSVGVGIYTGVLLGAVQSRPFWNTNLVAQLFLVSALSTGCAALMLVLAWQRSEGEELRLLYFLDIALLTLELFIVLPYILHGRISVQAVRESLGLILGGPFTLSFWLLFVGLGLLAPLGIETYEVVSATSTAVSHPRRMAAGSAVLVLAGGFLLRYIFVYAGQMSTFR